MEYDVMHALQPVAGEPERGEDAEVSGYIIIVGGSPSFYSLAANPPMFSLRSPALYSAPRFGVVTFGPTPDG